MELYFFQQFTLEIPAVYSKLCLSDEVLLEISNIWNWVCFNDMPLEFLKH